MKLTPGFPDITKPFICSAFSKDSPIIARTDRSQIVAMTTHGTAIAKKVTMYKSDASKHTGTWRDALDFASNRIRIGFNLAPSSVFDSRSGGTCFRNTFSSVTGNDTLLPSGPTALTKWGSLWALEGQNKVLHPTETM